MLSGFFRIIFPAVLIVAAASFAGPSVAGEVAKAFSKTDIEKIVHDYIQDNPKLILNSVDDYQRKTVQAQRGDVLAKNKEFLFNDNSSPEAGNPEGDVTIVEFFDYNCGYCKKAFSEIQALLEKDTNIRIVFKDLPILGPTSETAAQWALAAEKQKKYFGFHKALMENRSPINSALLERMASEAGVDIDQAKKDASSTDVLIQLEKNRSLASQIGLTGTPAFIIGDVVMPGMATLEELEQKISEIRKAKPKK